MALSDYSWADQMVHRIAFGVPVVQRMLREMEQQQFGPAIDTQPIDAPIFIVALPRAGTTLLLELLHRHPSIVTHTYRHMPFVLSPILWHRLSSPFQVSARAKERSHGDGLMVNPDSPEAFEEVVWLRHAPSLFGPHGIATCDTLPDELSQELKRHIKALIAAKSGAHHRRLRYASKNNANIARIEGLAKEFPDARIIVPLRNPLDQAHSLLRQHLKARESHAQSRFARDYVRDIGHFEFGASHRPIAFAGFNPQASGLAPDDLDYWLAYWIAGARHISNSERGEIIDMHGFTRAGDPAELFRWLELEPNEAAEQSARALIRPLPSREEAATSEFAEEALGLYAKLRERAVVLD